MKYSKLVLLTVLIHSMAIYAQTNSSELSGLLAEVSFDQMQQQYNQQIEQTNQRNMDMQQLDQQHQQNMHDYRQHKQLEIQSYEQEQYIKSIEHK